MSKTKRLKHAKPVILQKWEDLEKVRHATAIDRIRPHMTFSKPRLYPHISVNAKK